MATVYIPQQPARYDKVAEIWLNTVDVTPAARFGDIKVMFDMKSSRAPMSSLTEPMKNALANFTADDFLVALGDPSLIAMCSAYIAIKRGGKFKLLTWDRFASNYICREIDLGYT